MRILLITPPNYPGVGRKEFKQVIDIYQPLGLAYIAAVLEKAGYEVGIIDAKVEKLSFEAIIKRVADFKPQIIGLSSSTPDFCVTVALAKQIRASGDYTIIVGGKHVSALPEETLAEECFDYGVVGEGEETALELVNAILRKDTQALKSIKGIVFRSGSERIRTPRRPYIEDLDTLPFPARHLLPPLTQYQYLYYKALPLATILTSRGCLYQCTFCDRAVFGNKMRVRSITNIVDEMQMLVRDYGVKVINIPDDLFTLNPQRVEDFCRQLLARNLKISWSCLSRVDLVNPDMLKIMQKAGCWMIGYGIESGNQRILDTIKKNITLETIKQALRWTRQLNIRTLGFFMLGLPGDSEETIRQTLRFSRSLPLDRIVFFITQPYPGSELYQTANREGKINKEVSYRYYHNYFFPEKLSYISEGLSAQMLKRYLKKAYRDFYLRPGYIFRQLGNYYEFPELPKRIKTLLKAIV